MYTTKAQIKKELREELQCPHEFIKHLERFDSFDGLKEAVLDDDKTTIHDEIKEIRNAYIDFCCENGLDINQDNRKARVGFFFV